MNGLGHCLEQRDHVGIAESSPRKRFTYMYISAHVYVCMYICMCVWGGGHRWVSVVCVRGAQSVSPPLMIPN